MEAVGRFMSFLKATLIHLCCFLRRSSSLPSSSTSATPPDDLQDFFPTSDADSPDVVIEIHDEQDLESPADSTTQVNIAAIHNILQASPVFASEQDILVGPRLNPVLLTYDLGGVVIGFCLTSAVEIALQSLQLQIKIPFLLHFLSLALVLAFSSFFVSNFFSTNHPRFSHALVQVGKLSVFIAFFLAITVPFSVFFKIILWSLCVLSLLAIAYTVAASGRLRAHA